MSFIAIAFLSLSMSADAFAAALGKGALLRKPSLAEAVRAGLIFGSIEAITPILGWAAGRGASRIIAAFDHWIAFGLLVAIGAKMIIDSMRRAEAAEKPARHSFHVLALTAIGTSIDALAVGVTLALIGADILVNAAAIGLTTFAMTTLGVFCGPVLGARFGRLAEAAGGVALIGIGVKVLIKGT